MAAAGPLTTEDRIAINDLLAEYAWALDTGDVDALVACFTPDAVVIEEVFWGFRHQRPVAEQNEIAALARESQRAPLLAR